MTANRLNLGFVLVVVALASTSFAHALQQTAARNKTLERTLRRMEAEDQKHRSLIEAEMIRLSTSGSQTPSIEYVKAVEKQNKIDARNMARLRKIIRRYGWPGKSLVGEEAAKAAFLIVQHSDLITQRQYLPMLKAAAGNGEARPADAALLEDRVLIREGKKQIYGTQIHSGPETGGKLVLSPIEDEDHVDERRASVGLMPLAEYLKHFGMQYSPPAKPQR